MKTKLVMGAGIAFLSNNSVLLCERTDGQGWCFPGGKVEKGERDWQAAGREAMEEAGLRAKKITFIGSVSSEAIIHDEMCKTLSSIFMCKDYDLTHDSLKPNDEISEFRYIPIKDVFTCGLPLFKPTISGLHLLKEALKCES